MRQPWLAATLPALALATMSVEAVRSAAIAAGASGPLTTAPLDPERVAAAFGSEKLFRQHGSGVSVFAPLSGFFEATDGWVRVHGNYPHHAERLVEMLGLADHDRAAVARAIRARRAADLEAAAAASGAIVVRVRTEDEWQTGEPGRAAAGGPLVATVERPDAGEVVLPGGSQPLAGVRVLDLTRVLAGPVCTRTLALLGADVLRIDPPQPAEISWQHLDTGQGKRSALLDLRTAGTLAQRLLEEADVLVTGYRRERSRPSASGHRQASCTRGSTLGVTRARGRAAVVSTRSSRPRPASR